MLAIEFIAYLMIFLDSSNTKFSSIDYILGVCEDYSYANSKKYQIDCA